MFSHYRFWENISEVTECQLLALHWHLAAFATFGFKKAAMTHNCQLILFYFLQTGALGALEAPLQEYGTVAEETEAAELAHFVRNASSQGLAPPPPPGIIRIDRALRIYVGGQELRLRPMSKAILILFLLHPEGIELKRIGDYQEELTRYYSRLSKSDNPEQIKKCIGRITDVFSNELNVNISRVNAALASLENQPLYQVSGRAGEPKKIPRNNSIVIWE